MTRSGLSLETCCATAAEQQAKSQARCDCTSQRHAYGSCPPCGLLSYHYKLCSLSTPSLRGPSRIIQPHGSRTAVSSLLAHEDRYHLPVFHAPLPPRQCGHRKQIDALPAPRRSTSFCPHDAFQAGSSPGYVCNSGKAIRTMHDVYVLQWAAMVPVPG